VKKFLLDCVSVEEFVVLREWCGEAMASVGWSEEDGGGVRVADAFGSIPFYAATNYLSHAWPACKVRIVLAVMSGNTRHLKVAFGLRRSMHI
jgi:hypothetical protein